VNPFPPDNHLTSARTGIRAFFLERSEAVENRKPGEVQLGTLNPDGSLTNVRHIKQSDMAKCPHYILMPQHYREDGTCKCNDPNETVMKEWGYEWEDEFGWM
jgi:hypothetical protein